MLMFDSLAQLSQHISIPLAPPTEHHAGGANREADWAYRLRGPDRPVGAGGGWLLTRAYEDRNSDGALIAYEIDENDAKTGRCALLRHPWDEETDDRELPRLLSSDIWDGPNTNLSDVDAFLQR